MAMVKTGYQAVYRPKAVFFKDLVQEQEQIIQQVLVLGPDDKPVMAIYPMQLQKDGSWRIDGCYLQAVNSQFL